MRLSKPPGCFGSRRCRRRTSRPSVRCGSRWLASTWPRSTGLFEAFREMLGSAYSPDVELTVLASGLGSGVGQFYRGADGVVQYLREWFEPFSEYYVENLDYSTLAIASSFRVGSGVSGAEAAPMSKSNSPPFLSCGRVRSRGFISTTPWKRPGTTPGCGSRRCRRRTWRSYGKRWMH